MYIYNLFLNEKLLYIFTQEDEKKKTNLKPKKRKNLPKNRIKFYEHDIKWHKYTYKSVTKNWIKTQTQRNWEENRKAQKINFYFKSLLNSKKVEKKSATLNVPKKKICTSKKN